MGYTAAPQHEAEENARACTKETLMADLKPLDMKPPTEADAKQATQQVSVAIKKLNESIREAADYGVEVTIVRRSTWVGARGSRSDLIVGEFKLVLDGLEDHDEPLGDNPLEA